MHYIRQAAILGVMALLPLQAMAADANSAASVSPLAAGGKPSSYKGTDVYWQKMDPEGKGYISKKDWMKHAEDKFNEIDANNDGKITKDEMQAYHDKMMTHGLPMGQSPKPDLGK